MNIKGSLASFEKTRMCDQKNLCLDYKKESELYEKYFIRRGPFITKSLVTRQMSSSRSLKSRSLRLKISLHDATL